MKLIQHIKIAIKKIPCMTEATCIWETFSTLKSAWSTWMSMHSHICHLHWYVLASKERFQNDSMNLIRCIETSVKQHIVWLTQQSFANHPKTQDIPKWNTHMCISLALPCTNTMNDSKTTRHYVDYYYVY